MYNHRLYIKDGHCSYGTILALDTSHHFSRNMCFLNFFLLNTKKVFSEVMDVMSSRVILCLATRKNTDYVSFYTSE